MLNKDMQSLLDQGKGKTELFNELKSMIEPSSNCALQLVSLVTFKQKII